MPLPLPPPVLRLQLRLEGPQQRGVVRQSLLRGQVPGFCTPAVGAKGLSLAVVAVLQAVQAGVVLVVRDELASAPLQCAEVCTAVADVMVLQVRWHSALMLGVTSFVRVALHHGAAAALTSAKMTSAPKSSAFSHMRPVALTYSSTSASLPAA